MTNSRGKGLLGILLACGVIGLGLIIWFIRQSAQPTTVINTASVGIFLPDVDDDPSRGSATAPVTIIAFEDFQCPFCRSAVSIMAQVLANYPTQVRFVYRDFPLYTIHPQAIAAAQAGECADEQGKFWQYHDLVFAQQEQLAATNIYTVWGQLLGLDVAQFNECIQTERYATEVQQDFDEGLLAGVNRTPTYFVNGQKLEGVYSVEQWQTIIEQLLQ